MNSTAIIVLNWNGADDTIACVESLLVQTVGVNIIIVDNASSDDSVERLTEFVNTHPNTQLIQNSSNSGFSGGVNVGLEVAMKKPYAYIGTLNPDAVAGLTWVASLTSALTDLQNVGIATGILARSDYERVDSTGDFYTTWGIPSPRGRDSLLKNAPMDPEYIFGATGGGFIAKREVFETIGLFDEKFFMYFEDVDLSFRAQLAGYKVFYVPEAIAYHKLSASTNKVPGLAVTQTFKNLPILFIKNVPSRLWWTILPRFWLAYTLIFWNAIFHGRITPAVTGWLQSIYQLPHAFKERRRIQSSKKVTSDYISSIILHDIPAEQTGLRKFRALFTGKS